MAIEAMKGAGMSYAEGSSQTDAAKTETSTSIDTASGVTTPQASERQPLNIMIDDADCKKKENDKDDNKQQSLSQDSQIKKAVDEINKKAHNSEAIFGIHDKTNRVTIKIVDKDTKEILKEYPPEQTLDMIAKVWEMAGILVDQKL